MSEEKNKEMLEQLNAAEEKASGKKTKPVRNSDGHVLTEAEIKRQAAFDEKEKKLLAQGYKRRDILISVLTANFAGVLLTLPFIAAVVAGYILRNGLPNFTEIMNTKPGLYFAGLFGIILGTLPLVVLHEKIHGWFWSIGAENGSKDIEFGFQKENLTPYCTCASPLSKPIYILGSMMPMTIHSWFHDAHDDPRIRSRDRIDLHRELRAHVHRSPSDHGRGGRHPDLMHASVQENKGQRRCSSRSPHKDRSCCF